MNFYQCTIELNEFTIDVEAESETQAFHIAKIGILRRLAEDGGGDWEFKHTHTIVETHDPALNVDCGCTATPELAGHLKNGIRVARCTSCGTCKIVEE